MPTIYLISQPGHEAITDVGSVEAVEGAIRVSEPGRYQVDEIASEPLLSGHTSRQWGVGIKRPDGEVTIGGRERGREGRERGRERKTAMTERKGPERIYSSRCRGRPRDRSVDSSPKRCAITFVHDRLGQGRCLATATNRFPVVGQQLIDPARRVGAHPIQHVPQVRPGLDTLREPRGRVGDRRWEILSPSASCVAGGSRRGHNSM